VSAADKVWELDNAVIQAAQSADTREWFRKCLGSATSPYLLQHADDPVDWREWGSGAFAQAKRRDVPLLISVGYSACHWCHVMHEVH
jgi:uncharacterized protein YyaL (SSP411 family)